MRKQRITLFNRELYLSERLAVDVLRLDREGDALKGEHERANDSETVRGITLLAVAVSDALKTNWIDSKFLKRRKLQKITSPTYLIEHCTLSELIEFKDIICELENTIQDEGVKKKTEMMEE